MSKQWNRAVTINKELEEKCDTLTAELAQARKATEDAQAARDSYRSGSHGHMAEAKRLAAEIRRAVDALRRIRESIGVALTGVAAPVDFRAELAKIDPIIAAYDAKHGK